MSPTLDRGSLPRRTPDGSSTWEGDMRMTRRDMMAATVGLGTAAAVGLPAERARAAAPPIGKQGPGVYRQKVGDFEITTLNDGFAEFPITALRVPAEQVNGALKANYLP